MEKIMEMNVKQDVKVLLLLEKENVISQMLKFQFIKKVNCACPMIYKPVCGENGHTYPNLCEASCQSILVSYKGRCTKK